MPASTETRFAIATLHQLTGKRYPKLEAAFENLDAEGLRELVRLCHDLAFAVQQAERRGAMQPWKR